MNEHHGHVSHRYPRRILDKDFQKCFTILCSMMLDFGMTIVCIFLKLGSFSRQEVSHN